MGWKAVPQKIRHRPQVAGLTRGEVGVGEAGEGGK